MKKMLLGPNTRHRVATDDHASRATLSCTVSQGKFFSEEVCIITPPMSIPILLMVRFLVGDGAGGGGDGGKMEA